MCPTISNAELGVCECPPGRSGPSCEQLYLGSCRTSESASQAFYALGHLKSCACINQLVKLARAQDGSGHLYLNSFHFFNRHRICYERKGVADEKQFSDVPSLSDPNIIWRSIDVIRGDGRYPELKPEGQSLQGQVPLDKCPKRCSERGTCVDGSCKCLVGFEGSSCEANAPNKIRPPFEPSGCINHCGLKGSCENGFCHCEPGWWGIDCTRSKAYEAEPGKKMEEEGKAYSRTQLKIYRYELPWTIAPYQRMEDHAFSTTSLYSAFLHFFDLFANDTATRTENPNEANLFYVPIFDFLNDDNAGDVYGFTKRAMAYVNSTYPHLWGRNQGKDHFFWLPGDLGGCWLRDEPIVQNPIKLSHWGLEVNEAQYTKMPHYHWVVKERVNKEYHCFKNERDVVAPCWMGSGPWTLAGSRDHDSKGHEEESISEQVYKEALGQGNGTKRPYLLFFGGSIRPQQFEYSGGARQAFQKYVLSRKHPDVIFGGGPSRYREATFCFTPYGDGWGNRIVHVMQGACIPVIVQDHVYLPLEDVLDYSLFSIRMRVEDIPDMMDALRRVTPEEIQRYRGEMNKARRAFSWVRTFDGQAYEYTLKSLRRKLNNLWGMHYL